MHFEVWAVTSKCIFLQLRDLEMELDEEKRRHNESIKILRKKERHVKEIMVSIEEQNQQIALLQEALDKVSKLSEMINDGWHV